MNNLQHISEKDHGPVLVTLNPLFPPAEDLTVGTWEYSHPQFTARVPLSSWNCLIVVCCGTGTIAVD
jgi:hypothetical protein